MYTDNAKLWQQKSNSSLNTSVYRMIIIIITEIIISDSNDHGIYNGHNDDNTNNSIIQFRIWLKNRVFGPKTLTSLQTALAADAHLAKGQFLTEETLNVGRSRINRTGTRRPTISKTEGQSITTIN